MALSTFYPLFSLLVQATQKDTINFGFVTVSLEGQWISMIYNFLLSLGAFLSLLVIIINAVTLMVSGHDPNKVGKALQNIQMAILGLIVVVIAAGFIKFVAYNLV